MARKYLSFDIETAKDVPGTDFNWQPHRPLGISCAAALPSDAKQPIVWHGRQPDGSPAHQMSKTEVGQVVNQLVELVSQGYTLLTWNGLGFDLDVLAEESGSVDRCRTLAINHVDMMFHVFCDRGFPGGARQGGAGAGNSREAGGNVWVAGSQAVGREAISGSNRLRFARRSSSASNSPSLRDQAVLSMDYSERDC